MKDNFLLARHHDEEAAFEDDARDTVNRIEDLVAAPAAWWSSPPSRRMEPLTPPWSTPERWNTVGDS